MNLVVRVNGGVNVFLTTVSMQFVDTIRHRDAAGDAAGAATDHAIRNRAREARSARTFPFTLAVGCGTDKKGTVTIVASTRDDRGRQETGKVSVQVN